jgi:hypothetical protein
VGDGEVDLEGEVEGLVDELLLDGVAEMEEGARGDGGRVETDGKAGGIAGGAAGGGMVPGENVTARNITI